MKRLSSTPLVLLLTLSLLLAACGGGVTGDPDFGDGSLPEGSHVEFTLGGTPYTSGNPNVQIGLQPYTLPPDSLQLMVYAFNTPYGSCGMGLIVAGSVQPGVHPSGNLDGFVGGGVGCTDLGDPIDEGVQGTLTLEQADGRYLRGTFDLTQAFKDGRAPLEVKGRFVVPYPRS